MSNSRQIISTATSKVYNKSKNQLRIRQLKSPQSEPKSTTSHSIDLKLGGMSKEIANKIKSIKSKSCKNIYVLNLSMTPKLQLFYQKISKKNQQKRIIAQQDFINKLRRKQHKRSKHLLQRLQQNSQVDNLMQIFEKWKKSENQNIGLRNRSQTIQQMKRRIRIRTINCQSNLAYKIKSQNVSPFHR